MSSHTPSIAPTSSLTCRSQRVHHRCVAGFSKKSGQWTAPGHICASFFLVFFFGDFDFFDSKKKSPKPQNSLFLSLSLSLPLPPRFLPFFFFFFFYEIEEGTKTHP